MLILAVLAAAAVFNVGVVNPDTHLIESYLSCDVDYETAVAIVLAEKSHYPDKVLAIFDDDAKAASDLEYKTPASGTCSATIYTQSWDKFLAFCD